MNRRKFLGFTIATSSLLALPSCAEIPAVRAINTKRFENNTLDAVWTLEGNPEFFMKESIINAKEITNQSPKNIKNHILRIFHFNDMHNHTVNPSKTKGDTNVLAQISKIYKNALKSKKENETLLLLGAGDDHTGNVLDELRGFDKNSFVTDSAYTMYSKLGVTAVAIGNHELDKGGELLEKSINKCANMPILSANIAGSKFLKTFSSSAIVVNNGLKIALIGLTTPNETASMTQEDPSRIVTNPLKAAKKLVSILERYCDIIVILSHLGYGEKTGQIRHDSDVSDMDMAKALAKISKVPVMIIGGHSHTVLNEKDLEQNNLIDGVLITQAGGNGSHLGEICTNVNIAEKFATLEYNSVKLHKIKKRDDRKDKHNPKEHERDDDIDMDFKQKVTDPLLALLANKLTEKLANIKFSENFSTKSTIKDRYEGECAIANFMNDSVVERSKSFPNLKNGIDLAAFNASGISAGVENQKLLSFQDWYEVMPYADAISLTQMSGKQIQDMVKSNASRVLLSSENAKNGGIFDTSKFISWGFLHFSKNLTYKISYDKSTNTTYATDIRMKGILIEEQLESIFNVCFSTYIASGFEFWNGKKVGSSHPRNSITCDLTSLKMHDTGLIYRNEIIAHIREAKIFSENTGAKKDGRVKFV